MNAYEVLIVCRDSYGKADVKICVFGHGFYEAQKNAVKMARKLGLKEYKIKSVRDVFAE